VNTLKAKGPAAIVVFVAFGRHLEERRQPLQHAPAGRVSGRPISCCHNIIAGMWRAALLSQLRDGNHRAAMIGYFLPARGSQLWRRW